MRFFQARTIVPAFGLGKPPIVPTLETPVRWYFCAPTAEEMPFPHAFASTNFSTETERWESAIGEVPNAQAWTRGRRPPIARGLRHCGTIEHWQQGIVWTRTPAPVPVGLSGLPLCCGLEPQPADGRLGLRGISIATGGFLGLDDATPATPHGAIEIQRPRLEYPLCPLIEPTLQFTRRMLWNVAPTFIGDVHFGLTTIVPYLQWEGVFFWPGPNVNVRIFFRNDPATPTVVNIFADADVFAGQHYTCPIDAILFPGCDPRFWSVVSQIYLNGVPLAGDKLLETL